MKSYNKIKSTLYNLFIKEYLDLKVYETDKGFITYIYEKDYIYIEDMFIHPKYRRQNVAAKMANRLCKKAKALGYKKLKAAVNPKSPSYIEQKTVLKAYGMKYTHKNAEYEYYIKSL